jgi:hypothetical protein
MSETVTAWHVTVLISVWCWSVVCSAAAKHRLWQQHTFFSQSTLVTDFTLLALQFICWRLDVCNATFCHLFWTNTQCFKLISAINNKGKLAGGAGLLARFRATSRPPRRYHCAIPQFVVRRPIKLEVRTAINVAPLVHWTVFVTIIIIIIIISYTPFEGECCVYPILPHFATVRTWEGVEEPDLYREGIFKLVPSWDKCINVAAHCGDK